MWRVLLKKSIVSAVSSASCRSSDKSNVALIVGLYFASIRACNPYNCEINYHLKGETHIHVFCLCRKRERDLHSRINMRLVGSIEWPSIFVMGVCKHRDHPAQYILSKKEYWWNSSLLKVLQYLSAMPVKTLPSIKRISRYMQQTICRNWLWHFSFRLIWLVFLIATSILL